MTYAERRNLALILLAVFIALILLTGCGTTHHALPAYEAPLAKTNFQDVRTTAYTHTESDHRQYSNHNALGGELHAAGPAVHRAEVVTRATLAYEVPRAIPVNESTSYSPRLQRFSMDERETVTPGPKRAPRATRTVKRAVVVSGPPQIGSAGEEHSVLLFGRFDLRS